MKNEIIVNALLFGTLFFLAITLVFYYIFAYIQFKEYKIKLNFSFGPIDVFKRSEVNLFYQIPTDPLSYKLYLAGYKSKYNIRILLYIYLIVTSVFFVFAYYIICTLLVLLLLGAYFYIEVRARQRKVEFNKRLPIALENILNSLKAGFTFHDSILKISGETEGYVKELFVILNRALNYKIPFSGALDLVSLQTESEEWEIFADTMKVAFKEGGDITFVLKQIVATLNDRQQIENEIKTSTASGRMSGVIITALMPIGLIFFFFFSPEYVTVLFRDPVGQGLLGLAIVLECIGAFWIWKVGQIDF